MFKSGDIVLHMAYTIFVLLIVLYKQMGEIIHFRQYIIGNLMQILVIVPILFDYILLCLFISLLLLLFYYILLLISFILLLFSILIRVV